MTEHHFLWAHLPLIDSCIFVNADSFSENIPLQSRNVHSVRKKQTVQCTVLTQDRVVEESIFRPLAKIYQYHGLI
jgi:hypothetical protein